MTSSSSAFKKILMSRSDSSSAIFKMLIWKQRLVAFFRREQEDFCWPCCRSQWGTRQDNRPRSIGGTFGATKPGYRLAASAKRTMQRLALLGPGLLQGLDKEVVDRKPDKS